jgi:hypothetical protein
MKSTFLRAALGAALVCSASSAYAHVVQFVQSPSSCPTPSHCIGGGDRLPGGTATSPARTLHVTALKREESAASNDVPEPGTLALMGIGAIGVGYISRRYGARKA